MLVGKTASELNLQFFMKNKYIVSSENISFNSGTGILVSSLKNKYGG